MVIACHILPTKSPNLSEKDKIFINFTHKKKNLLEFVFSES